MSEGTVADMVKAIQEKYGKNVAGFSVSKKDPGKSPTGIFPLDYTFAGGIPNGRISVFYGRESSGKSCLAILAIATYQKLHPDRPCVFVDVEGHYDSVWAQKLGVDIDKLVLLRCSYAEMYVDALDGLLQMEDLGLVVLDSLAAFSPKAELEDSVEQSHMGKVSQIQSVMVRKIEHALNVMHRDYGYAPPVIVVNQVRANFDKKNKYSPDDKIAGSRNHAHAGILLVKVAGYPVKDPKSTSVPVMNEITITITRAKMKTLNKGVKFKLVLEDHGNYKIGDIADEHNFILSQLDSMGQKIKNTTGGGFIIAKQAYRTQKEFKDRLSTDFEFANGIKKSIIDYKLKESVLA